MFTREQAASAASSSQPCSTASIVVPLRPSMSLNSGLNGLSIHSSASKLNVAAGSNFATNTLGAASCNSAYYDVVLLVKSTPANEYITVTTNEEMCGEDESESATTQIRTSDLKKSSSAAANKSSGLLLCFDCSNKADETSSILNPNTPKYVFLLFDKYFVYINIFFSLLFKKNSIYNVLGEQ